MKENQRLNHYVYKLTEKTTGEFYYGSRSCECNPEDDTKYMGSMVTWKPNKDNLKKEILETGFCDRKYATEREGLLIKKSMNHPLNRNYYIAGNKNAYIVSDETKRKISIAHEGKPKRKGWHHTPETIQKMKDVWIGRDKNHPSWSRGTLTKEWGRNISKAKIGHIVTEETRMKISKTKQKNPTFWTQKRKDEMSKKMKGVHNIKILDTESGTIYHSIMECMDKLKLSTTVFYKLKKSGRFIPTEKYFKKDV